MSLDGPVLIQHSRLILRFAAACNGLSPSHLIAPHNLLTRRLVSTSLLEGTNAELSLRGALLAILFPPFNAHSHLLNIALRNFYRFDSHG